MKARLQFHTFESSHQNKIRTLTRFFKTMNFVDKVVDENTLLMNVKLQNAFIKC